MLSLADCRISKWQQGSSYVLSLKDICTLEYIPELVERELIRLNRRTHEKPEYVALVTAMYRKYTDQYLEHGEKKRFV